MAVSMDPVVQLYDGLTEDGIDEARHHKAPPQRFRASEANNCMRRIWHRLHGDRPAPRTAGLAVYGVCGDADHDISRQMMEHYGVKLDGLIFNDDGTVSENLMFRKTFPYEFKGQEYDVELTCRADGVIETPQGRCLLEIKGMGFWKYKYLNEAFEQGGHEAALTYVYKKSPSYIDQCMVTMKLCGFDRAYLLVKDRSTGTLGLHNSKTGERSGIYIDFDEDHFNDILQRFGYVARKLREGKPPIPEHPKGMQECGYCEFRYRCHDMFDRKGEIIYPGPNVEENHDGDSKFDKADGGT